MFAMLMIFIGPLISQSMPMDHTAPMNMSASMDMGDDAPGCHGESPHHARLGENVASEDKTRQKQARTRSLLTVNEQSEPVFNAGLSNAVVFTLPGSQPGKSPGEQHVLWEKCGYCSLLFNCPALPSGLSFASLATTPTPCSLIPATRLGHARQTVFPGALTRAPPIVA
nr:DUF2946 domain-containing protein [Pseudomonas sp. LD120]